MYTTKLYLKNCLIEIFLNIFYLKNSKDSVKIHNSPKKGGYLGEGFIKKDPHPGGEV